MSSNEGSDNEASQATTSSGRKQKQYSVMFKLQVVEWAKRNRNNNGEPNKRATAKHFGVSPKNVRRWVLQAGHLQVRKMRKGGNQAKNLPGQGRPVKNKDFELALNEWVSEGRAGKYKVTRDLIVARAKQLQEKLPEDRRLNLSHGWLESFMRRNKWTLRTPTSVAQKPPADYQDRAVKFVIAVEAMRKQYKFKHCYGADETGVWLNPTGGLCVEQIGRKDVTVLSAGNTKLRITVMLTARSDGKREKPFVLLPFGPNARCKKEVEKKFAGKLHLIWMDTTWMNNAITAIYLNKVFGRVFNPQRLLVWDQFSAHKSADTKAVLKQLKIETVLVPAGCTRFVQPADASWNAPFKLDASVKTDVLIRSFKACGILNKPDGSEDVLIHCLKEGNGMPDGLHLLEQARQNAVDQDLPQLMQGLEVEAPEDSEDDAGNDSDVSVISGGDQNVEESDDGEYVEGDSSDSEF